MARGPKISKLILFILRYILPIKRRVIKYIHSFEINFLLGLFLAVSIKQLINHTLTNVPHSFIKMLSAVSNLTERQEFFSIKIIISDDKKMSLKFVQNIMKLGTRRNIEKVKSNEPPSPQEEAFKKDILY